MTGPYHPGGGPMPAPHWASGPGVRVHVADVVIDDPSWARDPVSRSGPAIVVVIPVWDNPPEVRSVAAVEGRRRPGSAYGPRAVRLREALAAARRDGGLTQAQLAMKLGRPQSFVSK